MLTKDAGERNATLQDVFITGLDLAVRCTGIFLPLLTDQHSVSRKEGREAMLVHQSTIMFPGSHAPAHGADFSDVFSSEDGIETMGSDFRKDKSHSCLSIRKAVEFF